VGEGRREIPEPDAVNLAEKVDRMAQKASLLNAKNATKGGVSGE
jgi:hypothetical protein